jgi:hypothetical protein
MVTTLNIVTQCSQVKRTQYLGERQENLRQENGIPLYFPVFNFLVSMFLSALPIQLLLCRAGFPGQNLPAQQSASPRNTKPFASRPASSNSFPTMALGTCRFRWRLKARETRLLIYLLVLLGVVAWKFVPRPWYPSLTLETPHYVIYSSAMRAQTEETAQAMELLYNAYSNRLGSLPQFQPAHPKLRVKLFKDRDELRRVNPGLGWAEAFYREPHCLAYYSARCPARLTQTPGRNVLPAKYGIEALAARRCARLVPPGLNSLRNSSVERPSERAVAERACSLLPIAERCTPLLASHRTRRSLAIKPAASQRR